MYWNYRGNTLEPQAVSFVERLSIFRRCTIAGSTTVDPHLSVLNGTSSCLDM